jgi:endonuclease YncB( thermonuclease family)
MGVKVIEWKDTKPFVPPLKIGQVIKVYDGDTITIAASLPIPNAPIYRFPVRLRGIDAPEMKCKNEDEKIAARISQKALEDLILHKNVTLKNVETEKYGRILADVFFYDVNLSEFMLKNNYAVEYDGGTKKSPDSWLDFQATGIVE